MPLFSPLLLGKTPALVSDHEMLLESVRGIITGTLGEALSSSDHRDLDNSSIYRFAQGSVADDMLEDVSVVIFGRG